MLFLKILYSTINLIKIILLLFFLNLILHTRFKKYRIESNVINIYFFYNNNNTLLKTLRKIIYTLWKLNHFQFTLYIAVCPSTTSYIRY